MTRALVPAAGLVLALALAASGHPASTREAAPPVKAAARPLPEGSAPVPGKLDAYGGYKEVATPSRGTGFFRVQKAGDRWTFITPEGHPFWLRAVYGIDITDGGAAYVEALKAKYGAEYIPWWTYVQQAGRRMRGWGFNAFGEYSSPYAFPIPSYGRRETNAEKLPFIRLISPSYYGKAVFSVKNIQFGVDKEVTPDLWRVEGFPDVFDPAFEKAAAHFARGEEMFQDPSVLAQAPWIVGVTSDDRDYLFGFGSIRSMGGWHNHLGWIAMATAPAQASNPGIWRGATQGITYTDQTVYTKLALRDWLRAKYRSLNALNAAWGSSYTTWDSDGAPWPRGKGVLDESGRGAWIGKDFYSLSDAAPAVRADLDAFVGVMADRYFSVVAKAIRQVHPNHLVFSPAAISSRAHPEVLKAAGRHCDVLQIEGHWDTDDQLRRAYDLARKPFFVWITLMSQTDSPLAGKPGWDHSDLPTQEERGRAYAALIRRLLTLRASDGSYPVVGIDWWAWTDKVTGGEGNNFGLVSNRDNAYDGREAVRAAGKDPWGFPSGGEAKDYGNFLAWVTRANAEVEGVLQSQMGAAASRETRK
jgi:agarase